jgi:hypothetical protein
MWSQNSQNSNQYTLLYTHPKPPFGSYGSFYTIGRIVLSTRYFTVKATLNGEGNGKVGYLVSFSLVESTTTRMSTVPKLTPNSTSSFLNSPFVLRILWVGSWRPEATVC